MSELDELIGFLRDDRPAVRRGAVEAVLGLAASDDGKALLRRTTVAASLRRLIADVPDVAAAAVKAMINLSADAEMMEQLLRTGMVTALMESLREEDCAHKRLIVMLLTNLSQTSEGCDQLLQKTEAGGGLMGLHVRRLLQWFLAKKGPAAAPSTPSRRALTDLEHGDEADTFEFVASILQNVTQQVEARRILLEPERGILPVLLGQLTSPSVLRRRGVAGSIRNCCFEAKDGSKYLEYMLSPGVDVVTALLLPLAGPDRYTAGEKAGMPVALYAGGSRKRRESDPPTRRLLLEALQLLAGTKAGRAAMRAGRAYPVIKLFHEWLEGYGEEAEAEGRGGGAASSSGGGALVGSKPPAGEHHHEDDDPPLSPDDEAAVSAINAVMSQLLREDEVADVSTVTGRGGADGASNPKLTPAPKEASDGPVNGVADASVPGGYKPKFAEVVSLEEAQAKAKAATAGGSGGGAGGQEEADDGLVTAMPDWTEDDPELPSNWQAAREETARRQAELDAAEAAAPPAKKKEEEEEEEDEEKKAAPAPVVDAAAAAVAAAGLDALD